MKSQSPINNGLPINNSTNMHPADHTSTAFEYFSYDLKTFIEQLILTPNYNLETITCLAFQIFQGIKHLHSNLIIHKYLYINDF